LTSAAAAVAEADEVTDERGSSRGGVLAFLRESTVLLAVAFLLAFLLRTFVVQVFYIPSVSMVPTLEVNDRIVVEKLTYLFREPVRGEIVVFASEDAPEDPDESFARRALRGAGQFLGFVSVDDEDFVKRLIGLPGDTITIDAEGNVSVNGFKIDEPYKVEQLRASGVFVVDEDRLFFLGDNRPRSSDSRVLSGLGFVDRDRVVGRTMVIVWPFDNASGIGTPDYGAIPDPQ
jgi:signal peptidase I